jgi:hypothetical protein
VAPPLSEGQDIVSELLHVVERVEPWMQADKPCPVGVRAIGRELPAVRDRSRLQRRALDTPGLSSPLDARLDRRHTADDMHRPGRIDGLADGEALV